ncbi:hypothetical protein [Mucilaginibacter sp. FT3.2]|uniref:hypothetical protein n=1 Tax=Mucilaginibacter sp. FT3.2 TaxID=2723090 RepID=UPI001615E80A|nr:hypothetical protein [Mucilaginibacter sp. FT3.2]MBB6235180.1 hypothetical protein [Mucilaginibacter sp. FT3.2]
MRNRIDIVRDIITYDRNFKNLDDELSQYPWDLPEPIIEITASDIIRILYKAITGKITFKELEDWANLIECRDDFSFQNEGLEEIIFQLANPTLNNEIDKGSLISLASKLESQL